MNATAKKKRPKNDAKVRTAALLEEETYWAGVAAKLTQTTVAKLLSPMIRKTLRAILKENGIDPDAAWAKVEAKRS